MHRFARNDIMSLVGDKPAFDFGESYGPCMRLGKLMSAESDLDDLLLEYGTAQGDLALREAIAQRNGAHADDVVVTVGGAHALFLCSFIVCDRGDQAVIASPVFPPARETLKALGASVSVLRLTFDSSYQPDMRAFRECLSHKTRLVSIASPQNPSGVIFSRTTLREMLTIMEEICPQAYLLVDETYREASYGNDPVADSACTLSPKVVSIASLSKCHGAAGLRIGWAITADPALRDQLVLGKFNSVVSCSRVDEALALEVLEQDDAIMNERRAHLEEGLLNTASWVEQNGACVEWIRPSAGAICCIRLRADAFDDAAVERFYTALAAENARVASGTWFGEDQRVFRLGFGLLTPHQRNDAFRALTRSLERSITAGAL